MAILYGGDYNPEQWPEDTWQNDWDLMKPVGINSATINVFSWALLEPEEGKFDFSKLDKIVHLLEKNHIQIVMATATGALPFWMTNKYPQINRVDTYGRRQVGGKRENACPNSPDFQRLAKELVEQLAKRYSKVDNIAYWHISNEYNGYCYCDNCAKAFRTWLKKEYHDDLESINHAWGTNFWSHTYHSWDEIIPPMRIGDTYDNGKPVLSGLDLAYRRFQSDSLLNNFKMERDIIKKFDNRPITTNLMGSQKDLDYFKWAKEMDVASWDNYPSFDTPASFTAMQHDLMRGVKAKPFMLMEQTPSQQNWQPFNSLKQPNQMRMLSYQAMAHGAKTIQFFQLKQARNGSEKLHSAVISHSLSMETRVGKELKQLGHELAQLPEDLAKAQNNNQVGIIFDWNDYWALEDCMGPTKNLDYVQEVFDYYRAFYNRKIGVDMISKASDFTKYKLIVAPSMYTNSPEVTKKIEDYVENGGNFVTDYMSGIADKDDNVFLGGYPGLLKRVLGLKFDETDALPFDHQNKLVADGTIIGKGSLVCDLIQPVTAHSLAKYSGGFYNDNSVLTKNHFGRGYAFYAGSKLDDSAMNFFMQNILDQSGIKADLTKHDIEIVKRTGQNDTYTFVINTSDQVKKVSNPDPAAIDLLTNQETKDLLELKPFDVLILKK